MKTTKEDSEPTIVNVAALYRVSTVNQVKSGEEPIPAQQLAIKNYCEEKNYNIIKEYFETGISAFKNSALDRDAIHDVLRDAKTGLFNILLIFKSNRLSRIESEYPWILKQLKKCGVEVWEVSRDKRLTPLTHEEALTSYIDGWLAEGESRSISVQVKAGIHARAYQGEHSGSVPPFGFCITDWCVDTQGKRNKIKAIRGIDPHEAKILNIIADLIEHDGRGTKYIAKYLNENQYTTRNGALWTAPTVRKVIKNPAIAGISLTKVKGNTGNSCVHQYKHLYDPEYYVHKDEHGNYITNTNLTIIALERWFNLMKIIENRRKGKGYRNPNSKRAFLLSGYLRCGYCGRAMTSVFHEEKYTKKDGSISIYDKSGYRCGSHGLGLGCSGPKHVNYKKIENIIKLELQSFLESFDPSALQSDQGNVEEQIIILKHELRKLERELKKVTMTKERWLNELNEYFARNGEYVLSKENIIKMIDKNEKRLCNIKELISEAKWKIDTKQSEKHNIKILANVIPNWYQEFNNKPVDKQNIMLTQIIDKVVYYRDKIEIYYKIDKETISKNSRSGDYIENPYINMFKVIAI